MIPHSQGCCLTHTRPALPEAPSSWNYAAGQKQQCCLQRWQWETFTDSLFRSNEQLKKFTEGKKKKKPTATEYKGSPSGSDANCWCLGRCLRKYHYMIILSFFLRYLLFLTVSHSMLLFPSVHILLGYTVSLVFNMQNSIRLTWAPFCP